MDRLGLRREAEFRSFWLVAPQLTARVEYPCFGNIPCFLLLKFCTHLALFMRSLPYWLLLLANTTTVKHACCSGPTVACCGFQVQDSRVSKFSEWFLEAVWSSLCWLESHSVFVHTFLLQVWIHQPQWKSWILSSVHRHNSKRVVMKHW